jgi:hypothetical protein
MGVQQPHHESHKSFGGTYLRTLHAKMFDRVWKWAGTYRKHELNIGCDLREITQRIPQLLGNTRYWLDKETFPIDECLIRFHHQLVSKIHPFPNGNGRHARMITDVLAVKFGRPEFTWGAGANLVAETTTRGLSGGPSCPRCKFDRREASAGVLAFVSRRFEPFDSGSNSIARLGHTADHRRLPTHVRERSRDVFRMGSLADRRSAQVVRLVFLAGAGGHIVANVRPFLNHLKSRRGMARVALFAVVLLASFFSGDSSQALS